MSDSSDQIYSMAHLRRSIKQSEPTAFLFFWGHTSRDVAQIGKECLSQWYRRAFLFDGLSFPTAEHWMMYEKARLFQDERIMLSMLDDENPVVAKKLGRQIRGFDEETWNREKGRIGFALMRVRYALRMRIENEKE